MPTIAILEALLNTQDSFTFTPILSDSVVISDEGLLSNPAQVDVSINATFYAITDVLTVDDEGILTVPASATIIFQGPYVETATIADEGFLTVPASFGLKIIQDLTDTASLTEITVRTLFFTDMVDTATASDVGTTTATLALTDPPVTPSDSLSVSSGLALIDTAALTDTVASSLMIPLVEIGAITDSGILSSSLAFTETVTTTDLVFPGTTFAFTESVSTSEVTTPSLTFMFNELFSIGDNASLELDTALPPNVESAQLSEDDVLMVLTFADAIDTLTVDDSTSNLATAGTYTDSLTVDDSLTLTNTYFIDSPLQLFDSLVLVSQIYSLQADLNTYESDVIVSSFLVFNEALTFVDQLIVSSVLAFVESVFLVETMTTTGAIVTDAFETATASDLLSLLQTILTSENGLQVFDSSVFSSITLAFVESVLLTETVSDISAPVSFTFDDGPLFASESILITSVLQVQIESLSTISDSFTLFNPITVVIPNLPEVLTVNDAMSVSPLLLFTEVFTGLSESMTLYSAFVHMDIDDTTQVSDSLTVTATGTPHYMIVYFIFSNDNPYGTAYAPIGGPAITQWFTGESFPNMLAVLRDANGYPLKMDVTQTFSVFIRSSSGVEREGTGYVTVLDYEQALISYKWDFNDITTADTYTLQMVQHDVFFGHNKSNIVRWVIRQG